LIRLVRWLRSLFAPEPEVSPEQARDAILAHLTEHVRSMRYTLIDGPLPAIRCNGCGLTSYNQNDVEQRYCGRCHVFHEDTHAVHVGLHRELMR